MSLFTLSFYLFGFWFFHYSKAHTKSWVESPCTEANLELRLILPFTLPFLIFTLLNDIISLYPNSVIENSSFASIAIFLISTLFLLLIMIFFPPILQWIWQCKPLPPSELTDRLETLCQKAKFKHAGLRTWPIMNNATTAAIVGVTPKFRYVMFTKPLLNDLSADSIEAVLAHEIGHSYHKHLILYPFIIFGLLACISLFSSTFEDPLRNYLIDQTSPSAFREMLFPFTVFLIYASIIALYFRLVFGFFSRLFEREADLHIFKLGLPALSMQTALLEVAKGMGISPSTPSWHHYSIQQRVDFLEEASKNRALIFKHHRKVKACFTLYLFFLFALIYYLFY